MKTHQIILKPIFYWCAQLVTPITKKDINQNEVVQVKNFRINPTKLIEVAAVTIDELSCSWYNGKLKNTFFRKQVQTKLAPVLSITVINHSNKTALLWRIKAFARRVFVGINGIPASSLLKPIAQYFIPVNYSEEGVQVVLPEPIQIPANQTALFQVTLAEDAGSEFHYFDHATQINFVFDFNGDVFTKSPDLFLNCESKHQKQHVCVLS
jgi:hypothetical protein